MVAASSEGRSGRGRLTWCYEDCVWFIEQLTLPEGGPVLLEGYARLILRTIFKTGLVELLCLLPKGNGKTTVMAGLAVFHLLTVPSPQVFIAAADIEQAKEMFGFAQHFCESEPEIARLVTVTESTRVIKLRKGRGRIRVLASDKSKAGGRRHSYSPTLALIDELHAHENTSVYTALRSAAFKGKRAGIPGLERGGIVAVISTAGHNVNGVLGALRGEFLTADQRGGTMERGLVVNGEGNPEQGDGRLNIAVTANGRNVMLEWACRTADDPEGADDLTDMRVVKLCNPASFVTPDSLQDALEAPGITPWDFARYRANVWTLAFKAWVPADAWAPMLDSTVPVVEHRTWEGADVEDLREHIGGLFRWGSKVWAAVDMARYRDCAAIAFISPREHGRPVVRAVVWQSGGMDHPVDYDAVMDALRAAEAVYNLQTVGWDPKYFDAPANTLTLEGLPMELFPQSPERMCPAAANARGAIIGGEWAHDGDPILRAHVYAASARTVGPSQFRVDKAEESGPPIDACVALVMAHELFRQDASGRSMYESEDAIV